MRSWDKKAIRSQNLGKEEGHKKLLRNRGLVERGGSLRKGGGGSKLFHQFSFRKACFHYCWNTFFSFFVW